jgi:hypothetical protein
MSDEAMEDYLIEEFGESIDYCRCGHSGVKHLSPPNADWDKMVNGEIKFKCEKCECVNFR